MCYSFQYIWRSIIRLLIREIQIQKEIRFIFGRLINGRRFVEKEQTSKFIF